jgi:hypothetical protein
MEEKQIFEDIASHLDDEGEIEYSYFRTEIARFKDLMRQPSQVPNTITAKDVIGNLIETYYHLDKNINETPGLENLYTRLKDAYGWAVISLIGVCNSLEISLPYSFIDELEGKGDYWFTSMMKSKTPLEQEREGLRTWLSQKMRGIENSDAEIDYLIGALPIIKPRDVVTWFKKYLRGFEDLTVFYNRIEKFAKRGKERGWNYENFKKLL